MFCNKCGAELNDDVAFCPKCGNQIEGVEATPEEAVEVQQVVSEAPVQEPTVPEAVEVQQAPVQESKKKAGKNKKGGKLLLIIAIIIVILVAIIGVLFFTIGKEFLRNMKVAEADEMFEDEDYEDAIDLYLEVLDEDSDHDDAAEGLEKSYIALYEMAMAENEFEEAYEWLEEGLDESDEDLFEEYIEMYRAGEIYDEDDRLIKQLIFDDSDEVSYYSIPEYDEEDNEIRLVYFDLEGEEIYAVENEYDADGKITATYFFENGAEYSKRLEEYDVNGNVILETEFDEETGYQIYALEYDSYGNVITSVEYDEYGDPSFMEEYDADGYLFRETIYYADGTSTYTIFNQNGDAVESGLVNLDGSYTVMEYDDDDYLLFEYFYNADATLKYYLGYEYFSDGIYRTTYDADGYIQYLYDYDEYDYLIRYVKFDSYEYTMYLDYFDIDGNIIRTVWYEDDYAYKYEEMSYDENGYQISLVAYDYDTDEIIYYILYDNDTAGNVLGKTCYLDDGTLYWYTTNELAYDGSVMFTYEYDEYDFLTAYVEYLYDDYGNCTNADYYGADGVILDSEVMEYNSNGDMIRYKDYDANGDLYIDVSYEYDEDGYQLFYINNLF